MAVTSQDLRDDMYEAEERMADLWSTARYGKWTPELGVSYGQWADQYVGAIREAMERRRQERESEQRTATISKLIRGIE